MKLKTYLFIDNIVEVFLCTALGLEKKTKKLVPDYIFTKLSQNKHGFISVRNQTKTNNEDKI